MSAAKGDPVTTDASVGRAALVRRGQRLSRITLARGRTTRSSKRAYVTQDVATTELQAFGSVVVVSKTTGGEVLHDAESQHGDAENRGEDLESYRHTRVARHAA